MEGLNTIKDGFKALVVTLIICVATQKGGASKTTTTLCLAVCAWLAGYRVAIIDLDSQGSASSWGRQRTGKPPIVVSCEYQDLAATIHRLHDEDYELVFIDTSAAIGPAKSWLSHSVILHWFHARRPKWISKQRCRPHARSTPSVSPSSSL